MVYIVTSTIHTIGGNEAQGVLSEFEGKRRFAQYFERAWDSLEFDTELEALETLRAMYPDRTLTVWEDTGKVLSTWGHESGLTSMKIKRVLR